MYTIFIVATVLRKIVTMWAHSFTETGSIALTRWFAPEVKKPSHFPSKSSFPFFGVEPVLVEKSSMVCRLNPRPSIYIDDLILQLECQLLGQTLSSGVYICNDKPHTNKQDNNEVQGRLFLKKPLPGMGRKANGSHEEFNRLYFQNPKGKGLHITTEMDTYHHFLFFFVIHLAKGYFDTYDLAKRDAEGNYQITGRVDDAIRIKGVWLEVPKIEGVMVRKCQ